MNKKTKQKFIISLCITLSIAVLFLLSVNTKAYHILELKTLDFRFSLRPASKAVSPIIHVDIDDQSLEQLGRWPWPRVYHEKMTSILKELGAKQILMDVIFSEEYTDNPEQDVLFADAIAKSGIMYLPFYYVENEDIVFDPLRPILEKDITISLKDAAKQLSLNPEDIKERFFSLKKLILDSAALDKISENPDCSLDEMLEAIEETHGWFLFPEDEKHLTEHYKKYQTIWLMLNKFSIHFSSDDWPYNKVSSEINPPIKSYTENIRGSGYLNSDADIDGITRRVPLFINYQGHKLPYLTFNALMDLFEVKDVTLTKSHVILKNAKVRDKVKDIKIPVNKDGTFLINWKGKWGEAFQHLSYSYILKLQEIRDQLNHDLNSSTVRSDTAGVMDYLKKGEAELFKKAREIVNGKTCIIGLTATGTHDLRAVPLQTKYPMVGVHTNLFETIYTEQFILPKKKALRWFIFLLTGIVIGVGSIFKLWKSFLLSAGYALIYFAISFFVFDKFGIWIDLVGPLAIVFFGFSAITSFRFFTEEKEKLWIKKAFSHYLSDEVIAEMINDPESLKLRGEKRNITVLFSDVRGFTSFSEGQQPEAVVAMLNEILTMQVKIVFKYNGTLDKFVGDELMAFWGAPSHKHKDSHEFYAVKTAIEIQEGMKELQKKWESEHKVVLHIGVGLNTGDMVVGNMGSAERMDYTVIGDNVNLGARLCSVAQKDEVIISASTYEKIKDKIVVERMEPVQVKGKAKPIPIYRVLGLS